MRMSEAAVAPMQSWLVAPLDEEVSKAIRRLRRTPDVRHVAVMPDVHLAEDVCIGVAIATSELLYPQAVGGDIGCGMLAVPFDLEAALVREPRCGTGGSWRGPPLGPSQGRYAGVAGPARRSSRLYGQSELPCRGTRVPGRALLQRPWRRQNTEPNRGAKVHHVPRVATTDGRCLVRLSPIRPVAR